MLDGCTDGSADMVRSLEVLYPLRLIEKENTGLTLTRNAGAETAQGRVLIYLDDDIEPLPGMVEAYMDAHTDRQEKLVIGYSPPVIHDPPGWLGIIHRTWWEDAFQNMSKPGWRFGYQDLMGCNFSVTRSLYRRLGGMDAAISSFSREDWEFAVRLIKSGAVVEYAPGACGRHHVSFSVKRGLHRKIQEGRAETRMAKIHPDIWPTLRLSDPVYNTHFMGPLVRWLAFNAPRILQAPINFFLRQLYIFIHTFHLHAWIFRTFYGLEAYWYWLGAAEELGTIDKLEQLKSFVQEHKETPASATVNLRNGLGNIENQIDRLRPDELHIFLDDMYVGHIPDKPGAECLKGAHLKPYILENFAYSFLLASTLTGQDFNNEDLYQMIHQSRGQV